MFDKDLMMATFVPFLAATVTSVGTSVSVLLLIVLLLVPGGLSAEVPDTMGWFVMAASAVSSASAVTEVMFTGRLLPRWSLPLGAVLVTAALLMGLRI
jgi:hypothetical protein